MEGEKKLRKKKDSKNLYRNNRNNSHQKIRRDQIIRHNKEMNIKASPKRNHRKRNQDKKA